MERSLRSIDNHEKYVDFFQEEQILTLTTPRPFAAPPIWIFVPLGSASNPFYRIHSQTYPDHFLHVQTETLAFEPIHFGANSSYWFLEPTAANDTFLLRNYWRPNYYIYRVADELSAGPLHDPQNARQAHWLIQEVNSERLLVPVHLDALWLPHEQAVVAETADFTRLPHFNGERDIHPNVPHISESIISPPLQPPQLYLKAGLHLHWALPDALHRGVQQSDGLHMPHVPDRWLVTKRSGEDAQSWVVESNYLYPPGHPDAFNAISYPFSDSQHPHPFRHMGRKVPLSEWTEKDPEGAHPDYLHPLTALGYGEPSFAAFYPNCYSVFGFYDSESENLPLAELKNVTYEIIGWHSSHDILGDKNLGNVIDELLKQRPDVDRLTIAPFKFAALQNEFGWTVENNEPAAFPLGTLYFARLTISSEASEKKRSDAKQPKVVLGSTSTEALASHLGLEIGGTVNWRLLEEQLEALILMPEVEGEPLDTTARFKEARHRQGFKGVHGGVITTIVPITEEGVPADAQNSPHPLEANLPLSIAEMLDELNRLEREYFQGTAVQQTLREQLFADWYKYMLTAYPPQDSHDDFPDIDEVAYFLKQFSIKATLAHLQQLESPTPDIEGNYSILRQMKNARFALSQAVDSLQSVYSTDIQDWSRFISILKGTTTTKESAFQPVMNGLVEQLPTSVRTRLTQLPPVDPVSEASATLLHALNDALSALPRTLFTDEIKALLPGEAQRLLSRFDDLTRREKMRLGRIVLQSALPDTLIRRSSFRLERVPDALFWEPNDPVVLFADADLRLTKRHGEDGRLRDDGYLTCYLAQLPTATDEETITLQQVFDAIRMAIDTAAAELDEGERGTENHIGFYIWRHQPWHPFMLEWAVEFFQLQEKGNHDQPEHGYAPDYLEHHYDFPEGAADFKPKRDTLALIQSGSVYTGRTIMLDYAQPLLLDRLKAYYIKQLAPRYYDAHNVPPAERSNKPSLDDITAWAATNQDNLSPFDQAVVAIHTHLAQIVTPPIAQALNGFHAALLQHIQTLQLPIADPLGFPNGKALAEAVEAAVGKANLRAPKPEHAFHPIRAGAVRVLSLRLVDTFGQIQTIFNGSPEQFVQGSEPLPQLDAHTLLMPPRLSQPARINANWLSAGGHPADDKVEMVSNAHPATSPICGWFVPNYYDNSILVHDQGGRPLGALTSSGGSVIWSSAPGRQHRLLEADILNDHLYRLVSLFLNQDGNYLDDALSGIESALENIVPATQHPSLALLVGRPLAVVRAAVNLELLGLPASNQSWHRFRQTLLTHQRDHARFLEVALSLRIGEHARLNDGLLGFWRERPAVDGETAALDQTLYLPQTPDTIRTSSIDHPHIVMHRPGQAPHLTLSLSDPPRTLTMLVDPRAAVHISSGILPVKTLAIPAALYLPALQSLEMTFYSGPIVTKQGGVELPLPTEPGFTWSLLTKENGAWSESHEISPVEQNATLSQPHVIREGWLKLKPDGSTR